MSKRSIGVDWVFGWMEARAAAAHALVGEAIAFAHEQDIGVGREERRLVLAHLVIAASYLRTLLLALRPELEELDPGAAATALADLGARHRRKNSHRPNERDVYLRALMHGASRDATKVRRLILRLRAGRRTAVIEGLEGVLAHLDEADRLCASRPAPRTPPDGDALTSV